MKHLFSILLLALGLLSCNKNDNTAVVPKIGEAILEIDLPAPDGTNKKLSDLKGKVVVLHFWASWCPYCRRDNPELVKLYQKYKDKGLEVYSVSLDKDKAAWQKGIKDDGLVWANHVSDLKKWDSVAAELYQVEATPTLFLIDKEGILRVKNFNTSLTTIVEKYL
jgi:thiol-disulfide isomerase/thioredoxin